MRACPDQVSLFEFRVRGPRRVRQRDVRHDDRRAPAAPDAGAPAATTGGMRRIGVGARGGGAAESPNPECARRPHTKHLGRIGHPGDQPGHILVTKYEDVELTKFECRSSSGSDVGSCSLGPLGLLLCHDACASLDLA